MDVALETFPKGLPTLKELREYNEPSVPPETAWIWGANDEVILFPTRVT